MKTGLHLGFFHLLSDEGKLNIKHAVNRQDKTADAQDEFSKTYLFFKYSRNIPRYFKLDFFSYPFVFWEKQSWFFSFFMKDINSSLISGLGVVNFQFYFCSVNFCQYKNIVQTKIFTISSSMRKNLCVCNCLVFRSNSYLNNDIKF